MKAPFPWFGGKREAAKLVWKHLGNPDNYIEPFAGSLAVLLLRPDPPKIETVNDLDCHISNVWRATQYDPDGVAWYADGPVNEADLHSRHRYLVLSDDAAVFRQRMRTDPHYYDVKIAGWWIWGACCWIGSGWCMSPATAEWEQVPVMSAHLGINAEMGTLPEKRPRAYSERGTMPGVHGALGQGINADAGLTQKLPKLSGFASGCVPESSGTHPNLWQQIPLIGDPARGVHRAPDHDSEDNRRPQLADTHSRGRGVYANDSAGTCEQRRLWLLDWFSRLRDRLRSVRVCCGDWQRVCNSESVTIRLGLTGVFLDAPYKQKLKSGKRNRSKKLYANDASQDVDDLVDRVIAWCLEKGENSQIRVAACCYEGEGYEVLLEHGWRVEEWKSSGGYGNRSEIGKANTKRERIFFSPHCIFERGLFDG